MYSTGHGDDYRFVDDCPICKKTFRMRDPLHTYCSKECKRKAAELRREDMERIVVNRGQPDFVAKAPPVKWVTRGFAHLFTAMQLHRSKPSKLVDDIIWGSRGKN